MILWLLMSYPIWGFGFNDLLDFLWPMSGISELNYGHFMGSLQSFDVGSLQRFDVGSLQRFDMESLQRFLV